MIDYRGFKLYTGVWVRALQDLNKWIPKGTALQISHIINENLCQFQPPAGFPSNIPAIVLQSSGDLIEHVPSGNEWVHDCFNKLITSGDICKRGNTLVTITGIDHENAMCYINNQPNPIPSKELRLEFVHNYIDKVYMDKKGNVLNHGDKISIFGYNNKTYEVLRLLKDSVFYAEGPNDLRNVSSLATKFFGTVYSNVERIGENDELTFKDNNGQKLKFGDIVVPGGTVKPGGYAIDGLYQHAGRQLLSLKGWNGGLIDSKRTTAYFILNEKERPHPFVDSSFHVIRIGDIVYNGANKQKHKVIGLAYSKDDYYCYFDNGPGGGFIVVKCNNVKLVDEPKEVPQKEFATSEVNEQKNEVLQRELNATKAANEALCLKIAEFTQKELAALESAKIVKEVCDNRHIVMGSSKNWAEDKGYLAKIAEMLKEKEEKKEKIHVDRGQYPIKIGDIVTHVNEYYKIAGFTDTSVLLISILPWRASSVFLPQKTILALKTDVNLVATDKNNRIFKIGDKICMDGSLRTINSFDWDKREVITIGDKDKNVNDLIRYKWSDVFVVDDVVAPAPVEHKYKDAKGHILKVGDFISIGKSTGKITELKKEYDQDICCYLETHSSLIPKKITLDKVIYKPTYLDRNNDVLSVGDTVILHFSQNDPGEKAKIVGFKDEGYEAKIKYKTFNLFGVRPFVNIHYARMVELTNDQKNTSFFAPSNFVKTKIVSGCVAVIYLITKFWV